MSAPAPWHEVEVEGMRVRWRESPTGLEVAKWVPGPSPEDDPWIPLGPYWRAAFLAGYHARRELVASLVAQERHGGGP